MGRLEISGNLRSEVTSGTAHVSTALFPVFGGALVAIAWNAPSLANGLALPVALFVLWGLDDSSGERTSAAGETQERSDTLRFGYLQDVRGVSHAHDVWATRDRVPHGFLPFGVLVTS